MNDERIEYLHDDLVYQTQFLHEAVGRMIERAIDVCVRLSRSQGDRKGALIVFS